MKENIFLDNGILEDLNNSYELLSNHSEGLNIFSLTDKLWKEIDGDWKKQLEIVLDYLEPLLKEGKLEVRINKGFKDKTKIGEFLGYIKTEGYKNKIIYVLNNFENIKKQKIGYVPYLKEIEGIYNSGKGAGIGYTYLSEEIDTLKEDIKNIMFKYCKTDEERQSFEEFHIGFRLPGTEWELV